MSLITSSWSPTGLSQPHKDSLVLARSALAEFLKVDPLIFYPVGAKVACVLDKFDTPGGLPAHLRRTWKGVRIPIWTTQEWVKYSHAPVIATAYAITHLDTLTRKTDAHQLIHEIRDAFNVWISPLTMKETWGLIRLSDQNGAFQIETVVHTT